MVSRKIWIGLWAFSSLCSAFQLFWNPSRSLCINTTFDDTFVSLRCDLPQTFRFFSPYLVRGIDVGAEGFTWKPRDNATVLEWTMSWSRQNDDRPHFCIHHVQLHWICVYIDDTNTQLWVRDLTTDTATVADLLPFLGQSLDFTLDLEHQTLSESLTGVRILLSLTANTRAPISALGNCIQFGPRATTLFALRQDGQDALYLEDGRAPWIRRDVGDQTVCQDAPTVPELTQGQCVIYSKKDTKACQVDIGTTHRSFEPWVLKDCTPLTSLAP